MGSHLKCKNTRWQAVSELSLRFYVLYSHLQTCQNLCKQNSLLAPNQVIPAHRRSWGTKLDWLQKRNECVRSMWDWLAPLRSLQGNLSSFRLSNWKQCFCAHTCSLLIKRPVFLNSKITQRLLAVSRCVHSDETDTELEEASASVSLHVLMSVVDLFPGWTLVRYREL